MLGWAGKPSINALPRYSTRTVCNKYKWEQVEDLISVSNVCGSCPGQTFSVKKSSAPNSSCQPLEDNSETLCRWGESKSLLFRVTLWPAKPVDYLKQIPSRFLHIFFSQQVKIKHKHESASSNSACPEFLVKLSFTPGTAHLDFLEVFGCKMHSKRKKNKVQGSKFWALYFIFGCCTLFFGQQILNKTLEFPCFCTKSSSKMDKVQVYLKHFACRFR